MAYERELIADSSSAIQSRPQVEMREERVISPYQSSTARLEKAQARVAEKTNQPGTNVAGSPAASGLGEVPPSISLSPAAAALARKEAKFRQQEQAMKADREKLEADRKEIEELRALKSKLQAKDYSGVEGLVDYNEYTNYLIEKGAATTPEQERIKVLDDKLSSVEKQLKDDVTKRFEAAVSERRQAVKKLVETDTAYPAIKRSKQEEAVVQHILDTWEKDSVDLSVEQAAKEVESLLVENAKKWAALVQPEPVLEAEATPKELPPLKPKVKTLTNDMSATGDVKRPLRSYQGMSDAERWAEARRRAEEKLKGR